MRHLLSVLAATLVLTLPASASFTTVAASVRALQAPFEDDETGDTALHNICTVTSINADQHYWLTAAHCVKPEMLIANHIANAVLVDTTADLAVLYTEHYVLPAVQLRESAPDVDQAVYMVGHPVGLSQIQLFRGRISSLRTFVDDANYMMFDMMACGGNSGSVVMDEHDHVVSVLQIGFGDGCTGFSGGAPWDVVKRVVGDYFGE